MVLLWICCKTEQKPLLSLKLKSSNINFFCCIKSTPFAIMLILGKTALYIPIQILKTRTQIGTFCLIYLDFWGAFLPQAPVNFRVGRGQGSSVARPVSSEILQKPLLLTTFFNTWSSSILVATNLPFLLLHVLLWTSFIDCLSSLPLSWNKQVQYNVLCKESREQV